MIIATRKSKLAQVQTDIVIKELKDKCNIDCEKLLIVTEGDKKLNISLNKIGGKGLFVKDIEKALLDDRAHGAVHSMKDVPNELSHEFIVAAVTKREDVRDVFISNNDIKFEDLKSGAKIGTSSLRRAMELKSMRNDIEIVPIRGNVQTRLKKMKEENLDGIVLAAAGLKRLHDEEIITQYFDPKIMLPAVAQGALGIECVKNSSYEKYFKELEDKETRIAVEAERSFMRELNGDCHSAIGVYTQFHNNEIYITGAFEVNGVLIKKDVLGNIDDYMQLGKMLAQKILK